MKEWYFWQYTLQSLTDPNIVESGNFSSQIGDLSEMQEFLKQQFQNNWKIVSFTLTGHGVPTPGHENVLDVKFAREENK